MNCRDFENVVIELAGGRMADPVERERNLAHAGSCPQCAARLEDERALAVRLAALAADDLDKIAPPRVEAVLLEAFWRKTKAAPSAPEPARLWNLPWELPSWTIAAAALLLIVLGIVISIVWQSQSPKPHTVVERAPIAPSAPPMSVDLHQQAPHQAAPHPVVAGDEERLVIHLRHGRTGRLRAPGAAPGPDRSRGDEILKVQDGMTVYANDGEDVREIATDFLLFNSVNNSVPLDRGKVVRVQIPRSALVSFGLPMNAERAEIPINAELLVGEDGVARAIRFIR